ncbi:hypothetical protein [Roseofilum sp. Guam]|uniref:hypothetical protein n=1 Tax=Roseofilum sp. Guam TaxID=2821502 RepID=UPI001B0C0D7A|nr:hypothetical protein [Roseofilum sp. Guam]MBP0029153.1 hypothetical protein [Roseofilum sp. Guam]
MRRVNFNKPDIRAIIFIFILLMTAIGCAKLSAAQHSPISPTYARDIAPILNNNCLECHRTGGIGPFPLQSYEDARSHANRIVKATADGFMPPWRAKQGYGEFRNEKFLSQQQIATLKVWVEAGTPAGNLAELPPPPNLPLSRWRLGEPDRQFPMPEAFEVPATGEDIYRYFVLDGKLLEDRTVTAIDFQPGAAAVVHHANFFIDYEGRGRKLDAEDPRPGFSTTETGGFMDYDGASAIGGWAPGVDPYQLPPDIGMYLQKGGDLVVEIHYHLNGQKASDRSILGLYFAKQPVQKYIEGLIIGTQDLDIPAGESQYWRHFSMDVPATMDLVDISPHMHYIGAEMQAIATLPNGSKKPLICIPNWDLGWQNTYVYRNLIRLPAGSRIDAWFRYDNSPQNSSNPHKPPLDVRWGWQSTDEMSEIHLGVVSKNWRDSPKILEAARLSWWQSATPDRIPESCR